jgi:flagellar hook-basal body complex protein FliE
MVSGFTGENMDKLSPLPELDMPAPGGSRLTLEIEPLQSHASAVDGAEFRSALQQRMKTNAAQSPAGTVDATSGSLANSFANRASDLSSQMLKDQQMISRQLEHASRTGDSTQLVKAMMALNDYQIKAQTVSKVISKGFSAFDQLTKLQ